MSETSAHSRTNNPSRLLPAVGDPVSSLCRRLRRGGRLLRRAADWDRFAGEGWEDRIMSEPVTDRLHAKQGRSIGRRILAVGDAKLSVYLKRHYRLSWWHGLLATLFPNGAWSPGLQEWQHLIWAQAEGFSVPRPSAGQLSGPVQLGSSRWETPHPPLRSRAARPPPVSTAFARWKRPCRRTRRLARELHRRTVFHKDLYFAISISRNFHAFAASVDEPGGDDRSPSPGPHRITARW